MPQPDHPDSDIGICDSFFEAVLFLAGTVAFYCYPRSSSFKAVFGDFDSIIPFYYPLPIILFLIKAIFDKFAHVNRFFDIGNLGFLVVILTSVYTVFEDKGSSKTQEKDQLGTIMNLVSSGAFTLMSMSMSRLVQLPYEVGASSFFLGCLMVQLIKINDVVAMVGGAVCWCSVVFLHYFSHTTRLHTSIVGFVNRFCQVNIDYITQLRIMLAFFYVLSGPRFTYPGGVLLQLLMHCLYAFMGARLAHTII